MSFSVNVYKVMIASPGDVQTERALIRDVLHEWNDIHSSTRKMVLLPVGWETHSSPSIGGRPQAIINKQVLKDCDILVGVFWTRIGTPTGEYVSGTVEEIEEHIRSGKPTMLYFSDTPVRLDSVDPDQYEELKKFKENVRARGLYDTYSDYNDFRSKFYRHIQLELNKEEYVGLLDEANAVGLGGQYSGKFIPQLSTEAMSLLKEASQDNHGHILNLSVRGGDIIQTNNKQLIGDGSPRTQAMWKGALEELEREGLIAANGYKREVFTVTREGYELADVLKV